MTHGGHDEKAADAAGSETSGGAGSETPGAGAQREDTPVSEAEAGPSRTRKERVLHTRVPAVLEEELKRLATNLRMPVSNVVRAILEDAIEAVEVVGERAEGTLEGIVDRIAAQRLSLKQAVRSDAAAPSAAGATAAAPAASAEASARAPSPAAPPAPTCPEPESEIARAALEGVIGFQRLVLASESTCTVCKRTLPRGSEGCRGVREESGPRVLLGPRCTLVPGSSE